MSEATGALAANESTPEERAAAAAAMGRVRTPAKAEAARKNGLSGGRKKGTPQTTEAKARMAEARRALWADPEYRARVMTARASTMAKRKTAGGT